jgi:hypothetical protein
MAFRGNPTLGHRPDRALKENGLMNLLNSNHENLEDSGHWVMLDPHRDTPGQQALRQFCHKLDSALVELGHIDYQLSCMLAKLKCDLTVETHDDLNGRVALLVEAGIRQAMTNLADELIKAKSLTDDVIADNVSTKRSQLDRWPRSARSSGSIFGQDFD